MPDLATIALFFLAAGVLLVIPGPAVLYIVARSIDQGRLAGLVSVLGVHVGTLAHVVAAALGVSALLVASALAFNVVKYLGAAYLIYLGLRTLLGREKGGGDTVARQKESLASVFWQGAIVNVLNPKTALFFLAFLPQFVDQSRGSVAAQILVFGALFVALGMVSDGLYAFLAGSVGDALRANLRFLRAERYVTGGTYIALGVATAVSGPGRSK